MTKKDQLKLFSEERRVDWLQIVNAARARVTAMTVCGEKDELKQANAMLRRLQEGPGQFSYRWFRYVARQLAPYLKATAKGVTVLDVMRSYDRLIQTRMKRKATRHFHIRAYRRSGSYDNIRNYKKTGATTGPTHEDTCHDVVRWCDLHRLYPLSADAYQQFATRLWEKRHRHTWGKKIISGAVFGQARTLENRGKIYYRYVGVMPYVCGDGKARLVIKIADEDATVIHLTYAPDESGNYTWLGPQRIRNVRVNGGRSRHFKTTMREFDESSEIVEIREGLVIIGYENQVRNPHAAANRNAYLFEGGKGRHLWAKT